MTKQLLAGVGVAAALWLGAYAGLAQKDQGAWKPIVPGATYKDLVAQEAKILQDCLAGTPTPEKLTRAKLAALMIAGFSVSAESNAASAGAVEQAALQLAKMLGGKGDLPGARKLAASLTSVTANPAPKAQAFDPKTIVPKIEDVMDHLRTQKKGGDSIAASLQTNALLKGTQNGIEEKLRSLAKKKLAAGVLAKCADDMVLFGYRLAVLGSVTHDYAPPKAGKKDPAVWRDLSIQMRDAAVELAQASAKKDDNAVFKASGRLSSACTQCHSIFR